MRSVWIISILPILAIIFSTTSTCAVPVEEWNRTFGGTGSYQVDSVQHYIECDVSEPNALYEKFLYIFA